MAASASVVPSGISKGSDINVVVIGFMPFAFITITVNQTGHRATSILPTDIYGDGTFTFGPIGDNPGSYTLTVTDNSGNTVTGVAYTINTPVVTALPITINKGDNITVSVSGFLPGSSVRISAGSWYTNQSVDTSGHGTWSIGPINDSGGPYTMTVTDGTNTATTTFTINAPIVHYTLTLSANGSGSVMNNPPGTTFNQGDVVSLVATSNPGASFTGWYEGSNLLSTNLSYVITMNADRTIVGKFTSLATVTVTPTTIVQNVTKITVAVTNFKPGSLSISIVDGGGFNETTDSSGNGNFTNLGPFGDSLGVHTLRVTDGSSTIDTQITITGTTQAGYSSLTILSVVAVAPMNITGVSFSFR
jgi:hypothetical protein